MEFSMDAARHAEDYYPETLRRVYVINGTGHNLFA